MAYWNTRGLRGSTLEELINYTNEIYRSKGLAIIQKIPTPIKPVKINQENRTITLAYFDQKSTVDYIGVVQGIPVCFDAKETTRKSLPIQNIHEHQICFMEDFQRQDGIAFLLVSFIEHNQYFMLPFNILKKYWYQAKNGGRKSIPYDVFPKELEIFSKQGAYIHYLEALNTYLNIKNNYKMNK
ncbi:Holliday junction resolvase RecU [Defluviitalea phaphyphila]|uniref:Holliday junction resolvase RecU n=1 Tax=Defluviitalea phaphyphila TaxID=1473580 RepID=UPI00073018F4|nr:Holliday junction resolvase RecU [Defluviitalea phaphyphila]